jgi:hypothetical protein
MFVMDNVITWESKNEKKKKKKSLISEKTAKNFGHSKEIFDVMWKKSTPS